MAKFAAKKTDMVGVFRIVTGFDGSPARILKAAFGDALDAADWASDYSKKHFGCQMALESIDVKIPSWDGRVESMTKVG